MPVLASISKAARRRCSLPSMGKGQKYLRNALETRSVVQWQPFLSSASSETVIHDGETSKKKTVIEEVINVATIRDQLGKRFQITGLDTTEEARNLALLLRAGALAAPIEFVEERTVGPSLGQDNIDQGKLSVVIAFVLVLLFMAWWYRVFGLVANLALAFNLVLIVAVLSMLQATLTLPGIAGIVLTVGMAVDANVLIFEPYQRGASQRQQPTGEHPCRLRESFLDHRRCQHHHLYRRHRVVRVRHRADQRFCDYPFDRHLVVDVHRDYGDPRGHQPALRGASSGRLVHWRLGRKCGFLGTRQISTLWGDARPP